MRAHLNIPATGVATRRCPSGSRKQMLNSSTRSVTISKNELAEIARSGYPETADEDPRRAAEAVGLFISDAIACLDRTG